MFAAFDILCRHQRAASERASDRDSGAEGRDGRTEWEGTEENAHNRGGKACANKGEGERAGREGQGNERKGGKGNACV